MIIKCNNLAVDKNRYTNSLSNIQLGEAVIICDHPDIELIYKNYNPNVKIGTLCDHLKDLRGEE